MYVPQMFEDPFSFQGRIRRREFCLSWLVALGYMQLVQLLTISLLRIQYFVDPFILICALIPALYFLLAQSIKRCHDLEQSGWQLIIPFYFFVLAFIEGKAGGNQYGPNPKYGVQQGMSVQIIS
jgi:uncharacterized membrane protein YhaH (DUF805 family)